jgi:SAM-dependent MidA family methyltransferase
VLKAWIREQILAGGPVPFAKYMEWALYHPTYGYYTRESRKFGREGDFYTSPGIHPVFAEVIADQIAGKWQAMGKPIPFTLIEFGAGDGRFARDLLARWREEHPAMYEAVAYQIVEVSPTLRERQRETLRSMDHRVVWMSEAELALEAPYVGGILTNELVDAYPVHRVRKQDGSLQEVYVDWDEEQGKFVERLGPLSDERIGDYLERYGKPLLNGQTVEVGLPGLDWYERALGMIERGYVWTIDYGFEADMLYHPSRMKGTLRGFYRHRLTEDPYQHVGEQDLTADINFSALRRRGEELGWETEFFGSQSRYLLESGILNRLRDALGADPFTDPDMKRNRAIRQLVMPGGIGDHFKVLVQRNLV